MNSESNASKLSTDSDLSSARLADTDLQTINTSNSSVSRTAILRMDHQQSTVSTGVEGSAGKTIKIRYFVTLMVYGTINFFLILASRFALFDSTFTRMIASFIIPIAGFFCYEWSFIHSSALTRKSRAFWDEKNILQTYQPRARFESHKFQPDPPTPGPGLPPLLEGGCIGSTPQEPLSDDDEKAARAKRDFVAIRDAHYANEFQAALKGNAIMAAGLPPGSYRIDEPLLDLNSPLGSSASPPPTPIKFDNSLQLTPMSATALTSGNAKTPPSPSSLSSPPLAESSERSSSKRNKKIKNEADSAKSPKRAESPKSPTAKLMENTSVKSPQSSKKIKSPKAVKSPKKPKSPGSLAKPPEKSKSPRSPGTAKTKSSEGTAKAKSLK